jgi:glutathione S-transferase
MIKLALALKGIEYKTVTVYPNQSAEFLKVSPMGKVPALVTEKGALSETNIILEYLDQAYPSKPLYPGDVLQQAKIKELIKITELYLELPARRCHAKVFFGQTIDDLTKKEVKRALYKGVDALARCAKFSPYITGDQLTAADIVFLYSADIAALVAKKLFQIDLLELAPGAKQLMAQLNDYPEVIKIAEDRRLANPAFKAYIASFA